MTFFKKDLKEIQSNLTDLGESHNKVMEDIINQYREDILKSFAIVDVRYQALTLIDENISKIHENLQNTVKATIRARDTDMNELEELVINLDKVIEEDYEVSEEDDLAIILNKLKSKFSSEK